MSVEAWALALNARVGNPSRKAVLLGLANHAHPDGTHCFPSVRRLAIYAELSESTVRSQLAELRAAGLIRVVQEARRYRPTEYAIDLGKLAELRDPDLRELEASSEPATARGPAAGGQASGKRRSGLRETASRPPAAGREPSVDPSEETLEEPRPALQPAGDQTLLSQVKAAILADALGRRIYAAPPAGFEETFGALEQARPQRGEDGWWSVVLTHPKPETMDRRMVKILERAYAHELRADDVSVQIIKRVWSGDAAD
ncbi:MAG: helix-turn-helix domain-containing protein [Acidimicrobiales bacterium]